MNLHNSSTDALRAGLRAIGRDVCPDALTAKAIAHGVDLPVSAVAGFSATLGRNQGRMSYIVCEVDHARLRQIIDQLIGKAVA
jgi:hypothetical protein